MANPMRRRLSSVILLLVVWQVAGIAYAEDDTLTVVEEGATPNDIINVIELPGSGSIKGSAQATFGARNTTEAEKSRVDYGRQVVEEAKSFRMSDEIHNSREVRETVMDHTGVLDIREAARESARPDKSGQP